MKGFRRWTGVICPRGHPGGRNRAATRHCGTRGSGACTDCRSRHRALLDVQRVTESIGGRSADHRSLDAGEPAGPERGGDDPARPAGRAPDQRVRLRRGRDRAQALPGQLPLDLAERRRADRLPVPLRGRVEHRHPVRVRLQQQRHPRRSGRRLRLRGLPGPVRHGRLLEVSDRPDRDPDVPEVPLEGHARREASRQPGHAGARGLVLAGRAERLPALLEEPLGPADSDRRLGRPLPDEPPDAACLRRAGGPERHPQLRRDPASGPTTSHRGGAATSTTTPAGAAGCRWGRSS